MITRREKGRELRGVVCVFPSLTRTRKRYIDPKSAVIFSYSFPPHHQPLTYRLLFYYILIGASSVVYRRHTRVCFIT